MGVLRTYSVRLDRESSTWGAQKWNSAGETGQREALGVQKWNSAGETDEGREGPQ